MFIFQLAQRLSPRAVWGFSSCLFSMCVNNPKRLYRAIHLSQNTLQWIYYLLIIQYRLNKGFKGSFKHVSWTKIEVLNTPRLKVE